MSTRNHTIKSDLVQVSRLQLKHLEDGTTADLIGGILQLSATSLRLSSKASLDQLRSILDEEVPRWLFGAVCNLHQLRKSVPDLTFR